MTRPATTWDLTLELNHDGVRLLRRAVGAPRELGAVRLDDPDFVAQLADLRGRFGGEAPVEAEVQLPRSLVLFLDTDGIDAAEVEARAEARTACPLDQLVLCRAGSVAAAVERATIDDARDFAEAHGFKPMAFVAYRGGPGSASIAFDAARPAPFTFRSRRAAAEDEPVSAHTSLPDADSNAVSAPELLPVFRHGASAADRPVVPRVQAPPNKPVAAVALEAGAGPPEPADDPLASIFLSRDAPPNLRPTLLRRSEDPSGPSLPRLHDAGGTSRSGVATEASPLPEPAFDAPLSTPAHLRPDFSHLRGSRAGASAHPTLAAALAAADAPPSAPPLPEPAPVAANMPGVPPPVAAPSPIAHTERAADPWTLAPAQIATVKTEVDALAVFGQRRNRPPEVRAFRPVYGAAVSLAAAVLVAAVWNLRGESEAPAVVSIEDLSTGPTDPREASLLDPIAGATAVAPSVEEPPAARDITGTEPVENAVPAPTTVVNPALPAEPESAEAAPGDPTLPDIETAELDPGVPVESGAEAPVLTSPADLTTPAALPAERPPTVAAPPSPQAPAGQDLDETVDFTPPPPPGSVYDMDEHGFVRATEGGAVTPQGVMVYAGPPPVIPPEAVVGRAAVPAAAGLPTVPAAPLPAEPEDDAAIAAGTGVAGMPTRSPVAAEGTPIAVEPEVTVALSPRIPGSPPLARPGPVVGAATTVALPVPSEVEIAPTTEEALSPSTAIPAFRPLPRPESAAPLAKPEPPRVVAVAADAATPHPRVRPARTPASVATAVATAAPAAPDFAALAAQARQQTVTAAAGIAPATPRAADPPPPEPEGRSNVAVRPAAPTRGSVADRATVQNALALSRVNLIGVYGSASDRRALIRLPTGRYVKVKVGDRVDGGRVAAIEPSAVQYEKNGRRFALTLPNG